MGPILERTVLLTAAGMLRRAYSETISPIDTAAISRLAMAKRGLKRQMWPTMQMAGDREAALTIASQSVAVDAKGFSTNTCLPAASASSTGPVCSFHMVTTDTASS